MSEIDIEKKSGGVPWWAWLLGLLALAALIWYATAAMSAKPNVAAVGVDNGTLSTSNSAMATNTNSADTNMTGANVAPAMSADSNKSDVSMSNNAPGNSVAAVPSAKVITNILSVVDAKDPAALYNKPVKLLGAPVQAAGTKVFWIGPSFQQKMLVVTDANTNMNDMKTGVAQRDRVDIEGNIMEIKDFKDAKAKYNLDDNAITYLTNKKIMLMAININRDKN